MAWILCTSGAAVVKAGKNANIIFSQTSGATMLGEFSDEAEGSIVSATRRNWVSEYANVVSGAKLCLADVCSDLIGMKIISYDPSGYTSRYEAELILDILFNNANKNIKILESFNSNEMKGVS